MSDKEQKAFVAQCEKMREARKARIEAQKEVDLANQAVQASRSKYEIACAKENSEKAALDKMLEG